MNLRSRIIPTFLTLATALSGTLYANAETAWAEGVSKSRGWTDANKTGKNDKFLCWAASAANIIEWWQKKAEVRIPAGTPRKADDILKLFSETFIDVGRGESIAWRWYFGGCDLAEYSYASDFRDAASAKTSGRFLEKVILEKYGWPSPRNSDPAYILGGVAADISPDALRADALAKTLVRQLKEGKGVTLALSSGGKFPQGHAVTLWGIEYRKDRIKSLYITDSDDGVTALKKYDVAYVTSEETAGDGKPDGTPFYTWKKTTIYLQKYHGSNGYSLQSWSALDLTALRSREKTQPTKKDPRERIFHKGD